jgi:hypothetical protein
MALSDPMITNICFGGPDQRTAFDWHFLDDPTR